MGSKKKKKKQRTKERKGLTWHGFSRTPPASPACPRPGVRPHQAPECRSHSGAAASPLRPPLSPAVLSCPLSGSACLEHTRVGTRRGGPRRGTGWGQTGPETGAERLTAMGDCFVVAGGGKGLLQNFLKGRCECFSHISIGRSLLFLVTFEKSVLLLYLCKEGTEAEITILLMLS